MNAKQLKTILDTLVLPSQRDFAISVKYQDVHRAIALGVHKLAHHLVCKHGNGGSGHNEQFKDTLTGLVKIFNLQYAETAFGTLKYDRRVGAVKQPFWVEKEKSERGGNKGLKGQRG